MTDLYGSLLQYCEIPRYPLKGRRCCVSGHGCDPLRMFRTVLDRAGGRNWTFVGVDPRAGPWSRHSQTVGQGMSDRIVAYPLCAKIDPGILRAALYGKADRLQLFNAPGSIAALT
jgi:hypothetical protein